ncbi:hypothetical protein MSG28_014291 [Choristoneura fumiferana]|uniref:Uncharacterized protein n=1 Tax=Choristoneura fumiferana TaxID=7141 RepID=A0ACC0JGP6_CHOFU|nr:hypothetical protein MSG28_014291 [Choristoneura fumiferana]
MQKERRARNALYERERRKGVEHELTELAKVVGCDREVTPDSKLLRISYQMIKRSKDTISDATKEELEEQNKMIENEIAKLQEELKIGEIEDWLLQPF